MASLQSTDVAEALAEFDGTRGGVRGLLESSITTVPPLFRHPPLSYSPPPPPSLAVPTVDLISLPHAAVVDAIRGAAREFGVFQLVNHSIPLPTINAALSAVRSFNELPVAARSEYYSLDLAGGVAYSPFRVADKLAWSDSLRIRMTPRTMPDMTRVPPICRDEVMSLHSEARSTVDLIVRLLSEALGVGPVRLEEMAKPEPTNIACHFYSPSPEPDVTLGITQHTDFGMITTLIGESVEGLQVVLAENGVSYWVPVVPLLGAVLVNIGDLLQILSNDFYKSPVHRVVNSREKSRVSIAFGVYPTKDQDSDFYGPLPELLLSTGKNAKYRNFTMPEYLAARFAQGGELGNLFRAA